MELYRMKSGDSPLFGRRWPVRGWWLFAAVLVLFLVLVPWAAGRLVLAALCWLTLPGALLLPWLPLPRWISWLERAVLSWALSLSLLSMTALWAALFDVGIGDGLRWVLLGGLCAGALVRAAGTVRGGQVVMRVRPVHAAWLLVFGAAGLLRVVQISGLALPAWVDAPQHALLVRVAAEQGRAPLDLRPYLAVTELSYHWGYHVWLSHVWRSSGVALSDALLWSGQLLNWLLVPAVGALVLQLRRRPWAALTAALVVGLISAMPAYYVSWSRYTQLAGLLMLPAAAMVFGWWLRSGRRRLLMVTMVVLVGLLLVHVRVLIFAVALLAVQAAFALMRPRLRRRLTGEWRQVFAAGAASVALLLPWLRLLVERRLAPALDGTAPLTGGARYTDVTTGLLWAGFNEVLLPAAGVALCWLMVNRRSRPAALLIGGWVLLLLVLTMPVLIGWLAPAAALLLLGRALLYRRPVAALCGAALLVLNPWTVQLQPLWLLPIDILLISLFVPVSLLIGSATAQLLERLGDARLRASVLVLLLVAGLAAGWQQRSIINPRTVLADADDRAALAWISAQTPDDARFLVNTAAWMPGVPRLNDGGGWITPLSGRWTSLPPITFVYADALTQEQVRRTAELLRAIAPGRLAALEAYLTAAEIDYVYSSARGPLTPQLLAAIERLRPVFRQGDVVIFAVQQAAGGRMRDDWRVGWAEGVGGPAGRGEAR